MEGCKKCFKCESVKPISEFYSHKRMGDGHLNKCKDCTKNDVHNHRLGEHRQKVLDYDRKRYRENDGRRARVAITSALWAKRHPLWKKAQTATSRAVRDGRLIKLPCFVCGELKVEAHHPDYSSPLAVVWLCSTHHRRLHLNK